MVDEYLSTRLQRRAQRRGGAAAALGGGEVLVIAHHVIRRSAISGSDGFRSWSRVRAPSPDVQHLRQEMLQTGLASSCKRYRLFHLIHTKNMGRGLAIIPRNS